MNNKRKRNEQVCLQLNSHFGLGLYSMQKEEELQCKINNTRKDIFHDAAHVLGP